MSQIITDIKNPVEQTEKHHALKDTYGFVSTREMLNVFESKGWQVSSTSKVNPRKPEKQGYQKHLIRLEHPAFPEIPGLSEENASRPQICVLNSHDGTSAVRLFLGVLRMACLNGIIAGTALKDFKAVHSKNVTQRLREGIDYLSDNMHELFDAVQLLQNSKLDSASISQLTKTVVDERLKNVNRIQSVDYTSALTARRMQDRADDAWTTLNVLQESIVRGGIGYSYLRSIKNDNDQEIDTKLVNSRTRTLKSVPSQIRLNNKLFNETIKLVS